MASAVFYSPANWETFNIFITTAVQENLGTRLKPPKTVPHIGPKSRFENPPWITGRMLSRGQDLARAPMGFLGRMPFPVNGLMVLVLGNHIAYFLNHALSWDSLICCPTNWAYPNQIHDSTALAAGPSRLAGWPFPQLRLRPASTARRTGRGAMVTVRPARQTFMKVENQADCGQHVRDVPLDLEASPQMHQD
jgi:hypothetical protein